MRWLGRVLVLLLLAGGGTYAWLEWSKPAEQTAPERRGRGARRGVGGEGPAAVTAEPSRIADVPVTLEAVGTAQALNTVTVRSQVDGRLVELQFREGQDVRKGEVIARVDPTIYQAQYDQAVAKKAQNEANLVNARVDLQRYASLAATNFGSKQQADTQKAAVAQLEAQVKADQGAIDNAAAYLEWTTLKAPIDGRLGLRLVDQGNLVRAGDATGIVVITQLRPISVLFNLPQQNLRAVTSAAARGTVAVEALEPDGRTVLDRGTLAVVDNIVDQATGTVKLKATFPNADLPLWPGAFVNVRLAVDTLRGVVVVPNAAVQRGPTGPYVYGVADAKAVMKPVAVGRQDEQIAVITSGVRPPEPIVTSGFARLTDGQAVQVVGPPPAPLAEPPPRRTRPFEGAAGAGRERRRRDRPAGDLPTASLPSAAPTGGPTAATGAAEAPPAEAEGRRPREAAGSGAAPTAGP